jgi:SAM-dependent methyltransferase
MGLGYEVRSRLGRYEPAISDAYRGAFINLDDLATTIASLAPDAQRVAEIGSGDGSMANALVARLPRAQYVGIDLAPTTGRLFEGDRSRATFVVVDVVHHVPDDQRLALLSDAAALIRPGGLLAFKDWERGRGPAHALAYASDRYVSGDRAVRFMPLTELHDLARQAAPGFDLVVECRVPPRRNNVLLVLQRPERDPA